MGIKFTCPACGGVLNVKSELAGKRGRCPKCQAKINIPLEAAGAPSAETSSVVAGEAAAPADGAGEAAASPPPAEAAPAAPAVAADQAAAAFVAAPATIAAESAIDPIAEAPTLEWYAVPPGAASQYGPASGEEFRLWLQEGRVTADALVWRQDWPDWKRAGTVFPQLESTLGAGAAAAVAAPGPAVPPVAAAVVASPAIGAPVMAVPAAGATPLPTAPAAMPMMPGGPPVAQPAFGTAPGMAGPFPTAVPMQSDAFPIASEEPAGNRAGRGKAYRPRSNTGPIIAIVVLLVAMIPLSYFVWKVVSEQIGSEPAQTVTGPEKTKQ